MGNNDFIIGMLIGAGCAMLGLFLVIDDKVQHGKAAQQMIQECEKTIPRNEHCDIIAVHKGVINNE